MAKEKKENRAADIIAKRGIFFQAFSIYKEIGGFYDYGPIGLRIKRNIESIWRKLYVDRLGSLEIESTMMLPEIALKASGHVSTFTDPITRCTRCGMAYRADKLLESFYTLKGDLEDAAKVSGMSIEEMERKIREHGIRCEKCGGELSPIEKFNLMFKASIGPLGDEIGYLRPETAQGVYLDFKLLTKLYGVNIPIGIAQTGRVFRNEISPRQQLIRMREFNQMELQFFFDPSIELEEFAGMDIRELMKKEINFLPSDGKEMVRVSIEQLLKEGKVPNNTFGMFIALACRFMESLGFSDQQFRFREIGEHERAHYAKVAFDLEVKMSYGYIEMGGTHYRTDYDLSAHAKMSGEDLSVVSNGKKVIPHVVEASFGTDRILLALLDTSVQEGLDRGWEWLNLSKDVAPYLYGVFPLQKDEKLISKAKEISKLLIEKGVSSYYAENGSIGKRYAKADEIGVPMCITIDYQTLEDDTVTIRDRNTTKQVRKAISELV